MKISAVILFITSLCLSGVSSTCTFPPGLLGTWESPAKANVTFNDTHLTGYDVYIYTGLTYECHLSSEDYYVLRSDDFTLLGSGNVVNAAFCLYPTKQTADKYTYFVLTTELEDAGEERVIFLQNTDVISDVFDICNETSVQDIPQETKLLIRYGEAMNQRVQCPKPMLGTFWYYNHTTCSTGYWDVCDNRKQMTFNYTVCSEIQGFSANATVDCLYSVSDDDNDETVLYVYNEDSTVDDSTTYQYSCMVVKKEAGLVYLTQYPKVCLKNQTSQYVPSGGQSIILSANVPSTASPTKVSSAGLIAGVVVVVVLLVIVGVVGFIIYKKKFKKVDVEKRTIDKENTVVSNDTRQLDAVTPSVVKADMDSPRVSGSHGKISQILGPEYTMTNACDDTKAGCIEETPENTPRRLPAIMTQPTGNTPGKRRFKRIGIQRVPRSDNGTAPADTQVDSRRRRRKLAKLSLITPKDILPSPRTLTRETASPLASNNTMSANRSENIGQKLEAASPIQQLPLSREETFTAISRCSTIFEDNIGISLVQEKSNLSAKDVKTSHPDIEKSNTVKTKRPPTQDSLSTHQNRNTLSRDTKSRNQNRSTQNRQSNKSLLHTYSSQPRRNPAMTVKSLDKSKSSYVKHTTLVFKHARSVYKKKVKLVGKIRKRKNTKSASSIKLDDVTKESLKPKTPPSFENSIFTNLFTFDFVKEMKKEAKVLKVEAPVKIQEEPPPILKYLNNVPDEVKTTTDGDDNFFMCSTEAENPYTEYIQMKKNEETEKKQNDYIEENLRLPKSVPNVSKKTSKKANKSEIKPTESGIRKLIKQVESVAKFSVLRQKFSFKNDKQISKSTKEAVIEQKVLTKLYYNYDSKTNTKIKKRRRRNRKIVDLTRDFERIPTLVNWVECTDILSTPAMKMQNKLKFESGNFDAVKNQRYQAHV